MNKLNTEIPQIYIVGAGGVASQLMPTLIKILARLDKPPRLTIIDGDKLERRNLDRQLFHESMVGMNKAEALYTMFYEIFPIRVIQDWFFDGFEADNGSLFLSCVDNHPARKAILSTTDRYRGYTIMGGNEETDAEAFYYDWEMKGTKLDPRIYYPTILTDEANDPMRAEGCTGDAVLNLRPQLALANMGAAYYMLHLFWFRFMESHKLDADAVKFSPIKHSNNFSRCGTAMRLNYEETRETKEKAA